MSKNIKDLFDGLQNAEEIAASKIQVVGKDTTNGIVEDGVDTVIIDGSVSKIGVYGNGTDDITVKGYAGKGTAKSVAGIELSDKAGEIAGAKVVLEDGVTAKLVAGAKVEFTAEDKKYAPTSVEPETVVIADSDVVIYDAKVTDAFAGAVMTDTATSKKYKVEVQAITKDASIDVIGGTVTNVYAGGAGATSITENATINISGGKITNVYGGGVDGAKVVGDVAINIDMNSAATASAMSIGTIYAGGKNANVLGDVTITVTTNGAVGSAGKIGKIVGTPSGKGVVFGSKDLVLDAYQGDFAATVKGMDTVTIKDNSAVTFSKGQDKSMVNAEYIIELSEIDNSNQAAILTLKSDYKLNKLTVSIDSDLITAGGSFSRALIQGVAKKFTSASFDVNQINIKKDEGGLIADYQYELSFATVTDKKGNEVETGKLIFTYTGATLELSVDGYINRQGVANVLSSADDVVSFGWSYDAINNNYAREIAYNFKTMAGDDVVTIDDNTYFTGKLSLGAGNDTLTINGRLSKLDLSGAGENLVVVNGALDARNITTSADSANTIVINGVLSATEINNYAGYVNELKKVVFLYDDGSTTVDSVNAKKKIVSVTQAVYDAVAGQWIETVTPWQADFTIDKFITDADQTVAADEIQDLVLTKGDNTVVVNNAAGIGDITLAGGKAEVVIADAYTGEIDLRSASESTLVIDDAAFAGTFTGSRRGASNVIIAADGVVSDVASLDLKYKNATLELKDAVSATVNGWDFAGLEIEEVKFGYNAVLSADGTDYIGDFSGHLATANDLVVLGKFEDSTLVFNGDELTIANLVNSEALLEAGSEAAFGAIDNSVVTIEAYGIDVELSGAITASAIVFDDIDASITIEDAAIDAASVIALTNETAVNNLDITFRGDVAFDGVLDIGRGTASLAFQDANVSFANAIAGNEFVDDIGTENGIVDLKLVESNITLAADMNVRDIEIISWGNIYGDATLNVYGDVALTGVDFAFGADQKINLVEANSVAINDSDITIADDYVVKATDMTVNNSEIAGGAVEAETVTLTDVEVAGTAITADVTATNGSFAAVKVTGALAADGVAIEGAEIVGDADIANTDVAADIVAGDVVANTVTFTNLKAANVDATDVIFAGNNEVAGDVALNSDLTIAEDASVKADSITANGNAINVEDGVKLDVNKLVGDVTISGTELALGEKVLNVIGALDLDVDKFAGNVRVYDYENGGDAWSGDPANGITTQADMAIDGTFEADVLAEGNLTLSDTTRIERLNDEKFNKEPYGTLTFDYDSVMTVEGEGYAFIEKGVFGNDNLQLLGNAEADFTVANTLTLGEGGAEDDYVTWEDDAKAAINANIKGDVVATDIVASGWDAVTSIDGEIAAGTMTVQAGGNFTAKQAAEFTGDIAIETAAAVSAKGERALDGAVAKFEADVRADGVTLGANNNEGTAGAKLDITGNLTTGNITVGKDGAMTAGSLVSDEGDINVGVNASFTTGAATLAGDTNWDATAEGAKIVATAVSFEDLSLDGDITVGALTVGNEDVDDKFDDADLYVGANVKVNGDITMDADASNDVELGKDLVVNGALKYNDAANSLTINGSATVNALSFEDNLTINFYEDTREVEEGIFEDYAEFKSDITMTGAEETLTINKLTLGTAIVEMGNIAFGGADDGVEELIEDDTDTLTITTDVKAAGVTADASLEINGAGTLYSNVTVGKTLTVGDIDVYGDVKVGGNMAVNGDADIYSDNGLDLSAADLTMDNGDLAVNASRIDELTGNTIWDQVGAINGGDELAVSATGLNTISADITAGKIVAKGDGLVINGNVSGTIDATELAAFGGINTNAGVTFDQINIIAGANITADFTADDYMVDALTIDEGWTNIGGQLAWGAHIEQKWNVNSMIINDSVINGTVSFGEGSDVLGLIGDSAITTVDFGNSEAAGADMLLNVLDADATLATFGINFNNNLVVDANYAGTTITVDRNTALATVVADVNAQFEAIFNEENYNAADYVGQAGKWTATLNGVDYTFTFGLDKVTGDDKVDLVPTNIKVEVSVKPEAVTVAGSDANNIFTVESDIAIDGTVALKGGDDLVMVNAADLTLNALKLDGFDVAYSYNGTDWVLDPNTTNVDLGITAVIDFGAGADILAMVNNANVTAELVKFDTLTVAASFTGNEIVADMEGTKVTFTGIDETAQLGFKVDDEITVAGKVNAEVAIADIADVTFDGAVNGNVSISNATADFNEAVTGIVTLNRVVTYSVDDTVDPAVDKIAVSGAAKIDDIKAGAELTIKNVATAEGTANTAVLGAVVTNSVASITGTVEDILDGEGNDIGDKNVSTVTLEGTAAGTDLELNKVSALEVSAVSDVATLNIAGNVSITNINNVDAINVNADTEIGSIADVDAIVVAAGKKAEVYSGDFTNMAITGTVNNATAFTGTANADTLTLTGATIGDVNFGAAGVDKVDSLVIAADSTVGTVTFGQAGAITGGKLTGAVNFDGDLYVTANVGTLTGTGLADALVVVGNATIAEIAGVEAIEFGDEIAAGSIVNIAAGTADLDLTSFTDEALAGLAGSNVVIDAAVALNVLGTGVGEIFETGTYAFAFEGVNYNATFTEDNVEFKYTVAVAKA
ncbi:MAG: hypothetical protein IKC89_06640 [Lentisphaeria bacterium]|nr:hypothetical protein [Lentisphaeria bacterium]